MTDEKKPPQDAAVLKRGMDCLDFIEAQGQRNAAFSLEGLELMSKRAHALLTLLLGGAGATGAYALGQLGKPDSAWTVWALGGVSFWWFFLAAWVVVKVLRTQEVRPPACDGQALLEQSRALNDYVRDAKLEGESPSEVLTMLREGEIKNLQIAGDGYKAASIAMAHALDSAYTGAACTPVWALLGLSLARNF